MGLGLQKDGQKNRDNLSGIIKRSAVPTCSGNSRMPSYKILYKAMDEDCSLNVMIQGSSIMWVEG